MDLLVEIERDVLSGKGARLQGASLGDSSPRRLSFGRWRGRDGGRQNRREQDWRIVGSTGHDAMGADRFPVDERRQSPGLEDGARGGCFPHGLFDAANLLLQLLEFTVSLVSPLASGHRQGN